MHTNDPSAHPENVVDKESSQQYAAGTDVVQVQQLHSIQGKGQPEQVICYPVLWGHKTKTHVFIESEGCNTELNRVEPHFL